ncbi:telomere repeat binding factor family protein [Aspergillus clavatus NRRL 1]|uniref:MYB DNA-binding domain protein n=1 Tax=Aspergillus clavatus (strain ATCC 1007 / CBS 513.65 / DSM 816 / NCTC 3887 / NRRL 1 / QM 1276 / 107) TaxID=344612 RepID=A1CJF6_ASPCL|nr:MYB DNA-binding domain protein [Aspergillus clavatus NRRL 1]EAW09280.1 MYB DNA-binding domain protein [Aspergillus clavatus NRRL 1]
MDTNGILSRSLDESLFRELPQLQSLRIAPLRQPVSSRFLSVPFPLEPNASGIRDSNPGSKPNTPAGNLPANLPTLTEFLNAASSKKNNDFTVDALVSVEPPPKPILPAFVNLRALERFRYSSFDDDSLVRKRRRLDIQTDSFSEHLQLPIPQAQKEQRPPPFGPFAILNGLNEPPPNAALLPPIEPGSITQLLTKPSRDTSTVEPALLTAAAAAAAAVTQSGERREGRIEDILDSPIDDKSPSDDLTTGEGNAILDGASVDQCEGGRKESEDAPTRAPSTDEAEPLSPKTRGRSRKNLRKWTEEETTALLRGVVKCGIGNWTAILAQPELKFNKRSASNLKDRFRVCCPWAYRAADPNEATKQLHDTLANALLRAETEGSDGTAGKILLPQPRPVNSESHTSSGSSISNMNETSASSGSLSSEADSKTARSRSKYGPTFKATPTLSHRSKSTLASLGIPEPHFTMKSRRRSRRPFTVAEDEALLKGYAVHGFQWTLIQQDKRLNLSHRKATDLRDRFRTKFPHAYRDGGSVNGRPLHNPSQGVGQANANNVPFSKPNPQATRQHTSPARIGRTVLAEQATMGPIDPALSPPAPPQGLLEASAGAPLGTAILHFPVDENTTNPPGVEASWANNTLAPMVWDELA